MALNKDLLQEHSNLFLLVVFSFFPVFEAMALFSVLSKNRTSKSYFGAARYSPAPLISPSVSMSLSVNLAIDKLQRGKKKYQLLVVVLVLALTG